ncbi:MAG: ATP-grasp domain-containing protein [Clostridiales bacterium]|nr:ATP-grasp domain-containing protein [Clostridiales bacterium]
MHTVLLTDGEFTGMIRALRDHGDVRIVGFVFSEQAAHRAFLDASYIAPDWDDPEYIPFLEDVIRKEKVDLVFPIVTKSLELMASKAPEIKAHTGATVITSPEDLIHIANNKDLLLDHLSSSKALANVIPAHIVARNIGELLEAIQHFEKDEIACIMKPVCGENRDGFLKIVSDEEYRKAFSEGNTSLLTTKTILTMLGETLDFTVPMLVMPYLPGQEWDVDILAENGRILSCTIRKNLGMIGGLSACTETSDSPVIYDICEKILHALPLSNIFCLSLKEDAQGQPQILEINPRAMGSIYVSTLAGNSLVSAFFRYLENQASFSEKPEITLAGKVVSLFFDVLKMPDASDSEKSNTNRSESGDSLTWKRLTPACRKEYLHYYDLTDTKITDLTFHCRYAWDAVFAIEYTILEDCLVQISGGGGYTSPFMLMPLGSLNAENLTRIIEKVRPVFEARNWPFRICSIDEKYKDMFLSLSFPIRRCTFERDSSDYLYDADSLRNLMGKKYAKKRNHLKHFLESYPDHEYLALEPSLFPACLDLVRSWAAQKELDLYDNSKSDYLMIERIFRDWEQLDLRGGAIRINGKIVSFSIGSLGHSDTAYIHFEKADTNYDGLPVAQCKYIAASAFSDVKYINREEDLGMPGLRQSKESYNPIALVNKYKIEY